MATVTFIRKSALPVLQKGKGDGKPTVTISDSGTITLNSAAMKLTGNVHPKVAVAFEKGKLLFYVPTPKLEKDLDADSWFVFRTAKNGKSTGQYAFAGAALLQAGTGEHKYDYKASGNQNFDVEWSEKANALYFNLPQGALTPKPKVARPKKVKAPDSVQVTPDSTIAEPAKAKGAAVGVPLTMESDTLDL